MSDQIRRVGPPKAVGGTPGLVAAVLLAEYMFLALLAAVAGLMIGGLTATHQPRFGPMGLNNLRPPCSGVVQRRDGIR